MAKSMRGASTAIGVASISTRERILRVAEEQFSQHGYHGISLREILRIADVNTASGHYYFSSKPQLYLEAVAQYLNEVNKLRLELLDEFAREDRWESQKLPQLLAAYLVPHVRVACGTRGYNYANIMARLGYEPSDVLEVVFDRLIAPTRTRFLQYLRRMFPQVEAQLFARGVAVVVAIMATVPSNFAHHIPRLARPRKDQAAELESVVLKASVAALLVLFESQPKSAITRAAL